MREYHVNWEIELTAENHADAARLALKIQRDPSSLATVFKVIGEGDEDQTDIDLAELEAAGAERLITKKDLPQLVTGKGWQGPIPFLYCPMCRAEVSAQHGDYFMLPDDHVFICSETCGFAPLALVTKRTIIKDWRPPEEGEDHAA